VSVNSVLGSVWIAVVREIWNHRNKIIFKGGVVDHLEIFSLAQLNVWTWVTSKILAAQFSFSDWCLAPYILSQSVISVSIIVIFDWFLCVD